MSQTEMKRGDESRTQTPDAVLDSITNDKELVVTITNDESLTLHVRYLGEKTKGTPLFQVTHNDEAYGTLQTGTATESSVRDWIKNREATITEVTEITGFHGTIYDTDRLIEDLYR